MELKAYGDRGILLTALNEVERSAWLSRLAQEKLPTGCEDYVIGYDTILLLGQRIAESTLLKSDDRNSGHSSMPESSASVSHVIEVSYNGIDLEHVANLCALTVEQVIRLHCAPTYTVRMMGFSPGFPYLAGLDPRLHLDRRASPRNHIEPGTIAIGGSHAGIYSIASPGGWHLLGHTDLQLFNRQAARAPTANAQQVFALAIGDQVKFQPKENQ